MNKLLIAAVSTACLSLTATAQSSSGAVSQDRTSGNYIGARIARLNISRDLNYSNGTSLGVLFGHNIEGGDFAVEGEMTVPISNADGSEAAFGDLSVFTLGVYGAYRSQGDLYFKGRAGILYEYLNVDFRGLPVEGDAMGLSLGLGGGYRISDDLELELEYTVIEADIGMVSFGVNFGF